ncbi:MAG: hypothetical protein ACTSR2_02085 [Candidatus Hodarchaeales archaeon]
MCEKFGWTIQEFESQPWDQIELFLDMMNIEAQFQEREIKTMQNKINSNKYAG